MKTILKRFLPFLRSQVPLDQDRIERILIIGSGSLLSIERAIANMRARFQDAYITLLLPYAWEDVCHPLSADEIWMYKGLYSAWNLWQRIRAGRFDLKLVLFTGEGHHLLKMVSFFLPARRMAVFTEGEGIFNWSFDDRLAIWNHIRWRLGAGQPPFALMRRLGRSFINLVLAFVALVFLLLWHVGAFVRRKVWR